MSNEFIVPRNREQAYGFRVAAAVDVIERSYQEAALKKKATLCTTTAEQLDCAISVLMELFPQLPSVDAYASSEKLIPMLNQLYRQLNQNEDSVMRQHMQALVRARLYSGAVKNRVLDLTSDPALVSISTVDPLPLSLVFGERNAIVKTLGANQLVIVGQEPMLPADIMDSGGRPFKAMEGMNVNRKGIMRKLNSLMRKVAPALKRAPWGRKFNVGNVSAGFLIPAAALPTARVVSKNLSSFVGEASLTAYAKAYKMNAIGEIVPLADADSEIGNTNDDGRASAAAYTRRQSNGGAAIASWLNLVVEVPPGTGEIFGYIRTYSDEAPLWNVAAFAQSNQNAFTDVSLTGRTGSSTTAELPITGGGTIQYSEYTVTSNEYGASFVVRGVPSGLLNLSFNMGIIGAAGTQHALLVSASAPVSLGDKAVLSDAERLDYIADSDFERAMGDYFIIRSELEAEGVTEQWWLKAYHKYIVGASAAYTTTSELTNAQVLALKGRLLAPCSWAYFADLDGFLNKLYDDLGSLMALAQSTDYE